jgi:WD40 repeat protein
VFLAPLVGGESRALLRLPSIESICSVAFDPAGRWAATAACYAPEVKDRLLQVIDRRTGASHGYPLPMAKGNAEGYGVNFLRFVSSGKLMASGAAGLRRWDPETGANDVLNATPCGSMDASADGRRIVVSCDADGSGKATEATKAAGTPSKPLVELLLFDVATGSRQKIESHGRDVSAVALSPSGDVLASADSGGTIRVGRADGSEPHLLVGAAGIVNSLAFSPDGRWIASASGSEIRLWPMPDLSEPPLHTLPREALIAKLGSLTNVRVVDDEAAPSGYKVEVAPFPGWKDVPTW